MESKVAEAGKESGQRKEQAMPLSVIAATEMAAALASGSAINLANTFVKHQDEMGKGAAEGGVMAYLRRSVEAAAEALHLDKLVAWKDTEAKLGAKEASGEKEVERQRKEPEAQKPGGDHEAIAKNALRKAEVEKRVQIAQEKEGTPVAMEKARDKAMVDTALATSKGMLERNIEMENSRLEKGENPLHELLKKEGQNLRAMNVGGDMENIRMQRDTQFAPTPASEKTADTAVTKVKSGAAVQV